jgi:hypothetical protein
MKLLKKAYLEVHDNAKPDPSKTFPKEGLVVFSMA